MLVLRRSSEPMAYVCTADPAVDTDRANLEEYKRTFDPKYLPIKDGHRPSVFHLRRLTLDQKRHADKQGNHVDMAFECVAFGVSRSENFLPELRIRPSRGDLGDRLDDESMGALFGVDAVFYELAAAVRSLSGLHPLDGSPST